MMKRIFSIVLVVFMVVALCGCAKTDIKTELNLSGETKEATDFTAKINSAVYSQLDFSDTSEYENATKGLIEAPKTLEIKDENSNVVWSQDAYFNIIEP